MQWTVPRQRPGARYVAGLFDELLVDNFAGGGGASEGIAKALGRAVDIAINHDAAALAMHSANNPDTLHLAENVWDADPIALTAGRSVGLAWFSPDCKHFSKAKGGRPVSKRIRGLAWVVLRWAATVRPRVIILENVEEFTTWGPLDADERPCPRRRGETFRSWVHQLRGLGYEIEWRELRACDYGAPTIRKRLFIIARCDGMPIVWPVPTHGPGLIPYRTAAECIDWSIPCPSIFERKRPLAENTLRRIANGIRRFVIEAKQPFIVTCNHSGPEFRGQAVTKPMCTLTASRDAHGLVVPYTVPRYGEREGQAPRCRSIDEPLATVTPTGNGASLVAAFLAKHYGGMTGVPIDTPLPTTTARGTQNQIVTAHLMHQYTSNTNGGNGDLTKPLKTVVAGGNHHALVYSFLSKYYGTATGQSLNEPAHTITAKARLGLVTVTVDGVEYVIIDIGMRMLQPRELFRAQGFPDDYIIDPIVNGRPLSKTAQVRMCGNSVSPQMAKVLVEANYSAMPVAAGGAA